MAITWENKAQQHFNKIIENLPQLHRSIAQQLVKEKAEELAQGRGPDSLVEDRDVVTAFFQEVPPAFKDMMKRLLHQQGIDYKQYISES